MQQDFDFCILGTGLACSILAGSLSRDGARVLILDKNDHYAYSTPVTLLSGYSVASHQSVLKSNGALVQLLIKSGVGRYLEFKAVDTLLLDTNILPQGKEDVFADDGISLREKRVLMKFLGMVSKHVTKDVVIDFDSEPALFLDFLIKNLKDKKEFVSMIMDGLLVSLSDTQNISSIDGITALSEYVSTVGMFGSPTPFLCNVYGLAGELTQAFCRYSAVHGGVFMLRSDILEIKRVDDDGFTISLQDHGIITAGHIISCAEYLDVLPIESSVMEECEHMGTLVYTQETVIKNCLAVYTVSTPSVLELSHGLDGMNGVSYFSGPTRESIDAAIVASGKGIDGGVSYSSCTRVVVESVEEGYGISVIEEGSLGCIEGVDLAVVLAEAVFRKLRGEDAEFYPKVEVSEDE